ncbi:MAG: ribonuclease HII [Pseudomonadota bacterium]
MTKAAENAPLPDFSREAGLMATTGGLVAGVDEVGRGALAGPVVAAAVVFAETPKISGIRDSKRLTVRRREALAAEIHQCAHVAIVEVDVATIDKINIRQASLLAMTRALIELPVRPAHALVDGNVACEAPCPVTTVIKGDDRSLSIAAASIVAKVHRDELMVELDRAYPSFGWARNKGYASLQHRDELATVGPTIHHRMSFAPARNAQHILNLG